MKKPTAEEILEAITSNLAWVDAVRTVATNASGDNTRCEDCSYAGDLAELTNHYIQEHGYRLLAVTQATEEGDDGGPWHQTMHVLGKPHA